MIKYVIKLALPVACSTGFAGGAADMMSWGGTAAVGASAWR